MQDSEMVEISEDQLRMRPKEGADKWPISGPSFTFSSLNANVPEFVPGQPFTLPMQSSLSQDTSDGDASANTAEFSAYATPVLSSSAPELEGNWQQVKKKGKERTPKRAEVGHHAAGNRPFYRRMSLLHCFSLMALEKCNVLQ